MTVPSPRQADERTTSPCPGCGQALPRPLLEQCPHCRLPLRWLPEENPRSSAWRVAACAVLIQGFVLYSYAAESIFRAAWKNVPREILDFGGSALDALLLLAYFLTLPVGIGLVIARGWFIRQSRPVQWIIAALFLLLALSRPFLTWFPWER